MTDARDTGSALAVLLLLLWGILVCGRTECPAGWWQSRPGVCQLRSREVEGVGPRGGYVDESSEEPNVGVGIECTGGATLRQNGRSAWCQP